MAKKSFILHIDSLDILDDLTDDQVCELFRAIKSYQNGEALNLSPMGKIAFSPFKNQFIRDAEKYTETCQKRALAGSKGGKQKVANASNCNQDKANIAILAENKNDSKSDNVSDSKKEKTKKGSRLSQDTLPDEWRLFCIEERPDLKPFTVFDGFRDYWIGVAGAKGVKLDWFATWRNWVRNQKQVQSNENRQADIRSRAQRVSDKLDEIARRDIEENGFTNTLD